LATEKSYRHWIVEFLRFHRTGGEWRHPTEMGKVEIEAFLTHLAIDRRVAAKTQNQAFSAILFLYSQVLGPAALSGTNARTPWVPATRERLVDCQTRIDR